MRLSDIGGRGSFKGLLLLFLLPIVIAAAVATVNSAAAGFMPAGIAGAIRIFPNPFYPRKGQAGVNVTGLPAGCKVRISALSGELVWEATSSPAGLAIWNGSNKAGRKVSSGLYLLSFKRGSEEVVKKISVVK